MSPLLPRLATESPTPAGRLSAHQQQAIRDFTRVATVVPLPCLCGGALDRVVATQDRYAIPLTTKLCLCCGLMRSDPYYDQPTLLRLYRDYYRSIYNNAAACDERFFQQQRVDGARIAAFIAAQEQPWPTRVFEIGCAAGGILDAFRARGSTVAGCDYDVASLAIGRQHGLHVVEGGAEALAAAGPVDLIILSHVLEHVPEPVTFLRTLRAHLSSGGRVYIELPGIAEIAAEYGDPLLFLQNAHCWHFVKETLAFLAAKAGYAALAMTDSIHALVAPSAGVPPLPATAALATLVQGCVEAAERARWRSLQRLRHVYGGRLWWLRAMIGHTVVDGGTAIARRAHAVVRGL